MSENPWHRLPLSQPYVLPEDKTEVRAFNQWASERHRLRIDAILPEPFVGDPTAPIIILGNNPGLVPEKLPDRKDSVFVKRMRANLLHEPSDWPFVFFAPDIPDPLHDWWNYKLKELLDLGRDVLARSILAVEYFPYPSQEYYRKRWRLSSQDYSFYLVKRAIERKAVIVLTRGKRRWFEAVPGLKGYQGLCELLNPQTGTISLGNCPKFEDIRRAIEAGVT